VPAIVLRTDMPFDGIVTVQPSSITWMIPFNPNQRTSFVQTQVLVQINNLLLQGVSYGAYARVRVRLLGEKIASVSGATQLFLDGQSFATPGERADGITPRTDLQFPSGNLQKASDFDSWFYLAPVLTLTGLTVAPATVTITPTLPAATAKATLTVNYPPIADTIVQLSVITPSGALPAVSLPPQVKIPKGSASVTFDVSVDNTANGKRIAFELTANLASNLGTSSTQTATLAVTGFSRRVK